ncbi:acyltransferase [Leptospira kobayashii]|uniref:Acyltransferase n=1 Tax=Leptospira kobayashii TaxID=1917830 RepID=A0ABM7URW1_9LEPT|nr:1-acyl-sn-glycerol-3-phosphate acyltransferase [Leptospira kobayashii]BDA79230.1 acyltransferase [Leptospira kobayashii]
MKPEKINPIRATLPYDFLINLVYKSRGLIFHSIEEHFSDEGDSFASPYPSALIANHVSEADISALSAVYRRLSPRVKVIIPAREDILKKDFLQKEFRTKGILKLILTAIDKSHIIPFLLNYIGCAPIKRPFRDNARDLMKKGELRETVEAEWSFLVSKIKDGRNLFMFPEGTYNHDGYLNQIRKGAYYLKSKIGNLQFNSFTFTYDSISTDKSTLHISYGNPFSLEEGMDADTVTQLVEEKLGSGYVLTTGNLLSYILFKLENQVKTSTEKLNLVLNDFNDRITKEYPGLKKGSSLRKNFSRQGLDPIFKKLIREKYIDIKEDSIVLLDKLTTIPKSIHNLKKNNTILYHKNQLNWHLEKLDSIWAGLETKLVSNDSAT